MRVSNIRSDVNVERKKSANCVVGAQDRQIAGELQVLTAIDVKDIRQNAVILPESVYQLIEVAQHGGAPYAVGLI